MVPVAQQRLDGWKTIAIHLKRTVRTVQRWEKLEGLPVHRIGHTSSSSVFAYEEEVDRWWNDRRSGLDAQPQESPVAAPEPSPVVERRSRAPLLALPLVGLFGLYALIHPQPRFQKAEVLRPVSRGNIGVVAVSLDGKSVVYSVEAGNQNALTLRELASGEERILVRNSNSRYYGLTFSNDGEWLYFVASEAGLAPALSRIALTGGPAQKIVGGVDSPVTFSPSGDRMAYVQEGAVSSLVIAKADGTQSKTVLTRKLPSYLDYPVWSPDGLTIVATAVTPQETRLIRVDPETGAENHLGNKAWAFARYPTWLDSQHLVVNLRDSRTLPPRPYVVSYPGGEAAPMPVPPDQYISLSATRAGNLLAGTVRSAVYSVWTGTDATELRQVTHAVTGSHSISWTSAGRLLFWQDGVVSGKVDGTEPGKILPGVPASAFESCGADKLVYVRADAGNSGIWLASLTGGVGKLLAANSSAMEPKCSPDGEWVIYASRWSPAYQVPAAGGAPQVIIKDPVFSPSISRDNRWIAAYRSKAGESTAQAPQEIALYPREGGAAVKSFPLPPGGFDWTSLRWTADNSAIAFVESKNGIDNVWLQPVDGGPRRQVTHFRGGSVGHFDWAKDGTLAVEFGAVVRDLILIREQR